MKYIERNDKNRLLEVWYDEYSLNINLAPGYHTATFLNKDNMSIELVKSIMEAAHDFLSKNGFRFRARRKTNRLEIIKLQKNPNPRKK